MKLLVPAFVLHAGGKIQDWVERHDRLPFDETPSAAYQERNQQDWWKRNKQLRELLATTEREIERQIAAGITPSVLVLSWSQLARKLSCDRATLKHPLRHGWIEAQRVRLLALIKDAKNRLPAPTASPAASTDSQIKEAEIRLRKQRTETGVWFEKCRSLEQQVRELTQVVDRQRKTLERLSNK